MLLAQLLRAIPTTPFDDRADYLVIVSIRLDIKLVSFLGLLDLRLLLGVTCLRGSHHNSIEHAVNFGLQNGDEILRVDELGIELFDVAKLEAYLTTQPSYLGEMSLSDRLLVLQCDSYEFINLREKQVHVALGRPPVLRQLIVEFN